MMIVKLNEITVELTEQMLIVVKKYIQENGQEIINNYWEASEGKINYLGEWHTHSCKKPYPSYTDKKLLRSLIKDKSNVWAELFMLIVGRNNTFYLGMTSEKSKGEIIAEIQIGGDKDAFIFNR